MKYPTGRLHYLKKIGIGDICARIVNDIIFEIDRNCAESELAYASQSADNNSSEPLFYKDPDFVNYLREVNKTPELTEKDELSYLRFIKGKDELLEQLVDETTGLTTADDPNNAYESKDIAISTLKRKIVAHNQALIVPLALKYRLTGHELQHDLSLMELVSEGNIILYEAIDIFDVDKGKNIGFKPFAFNVIYQRLPVVLAHTGFHIGFGPYEYEMLVEYEKLVKGFQENNIAITAEKVGVALGYEKFSSVRDLILLYNALSIDQIPSFEEQADIKVDVAKEEFLRRLEKETRKVLARLTPREEKVLRLRFGIGEKFDITLKEVREYFPVTIERIRQIEAKAIRKVRTNNYGGILLELERERRMFR
ncbi:MAG: sigma-70 family RNA polymerase sigma factor [Nanoarchaeota archaeon]